MPQDMPVQTESGAYSHDAMEQSYRHYSQIKEQLEAEALNQFVRVDVATGRYSVGKTRGEARARFKDEFGDQVAYTFQIGVA